MLIQFGGPDAGIGAFVALFLTQDLAADFTGDGIVDNGDIGAFVIQFLAASTTVKVTSAILIDRKENTTKKKLLKV